MSSAAHFDVVIVGGGMAGLSQALALSGCGLTIAVLDNQPMAHSYSACQERCTQPIFSDRVSALTPASKAFMQELKVWHKLESLRISPYQFMQVWDADGSGSIRFSAAELHAQALGYIVENELLVCVLAEAAAQKTDITYMPSCKVTDLAVEDDASSLTLEDGQAISAHLLIGADGGNSLVRKAAGFTLREWSYGQQALVCTVLTEKSHEDTAWQRFLPSGPLAFLPLRLPTANEQHYCSVVWSCDEALAKHLLALDETAFSRELTQAFESTLGKLGLCSMPQAYPLQQRHATDYIKTGVALVGDAAHTIHPLAGQGINLGLADVQSLACVLKQAVTQGRNIASSQVLSRYQRERKPENLGMMLGMEAFKRTFGSDDLMVRWLRNRGMSLTDRLGPLKQTIMRSAMGL